MKKFLHSLSTIINILVYIVVLDTICFTNSYGDDNKVTLKPLIITSTRIEGDSESATNIPLRNSSSIGLTESVSPEYLSVPSVLNENTLVDTRQEGLLVYRLT